ncbi:hypothetical protein OG389_18620 [Streptomyces sp. NBC_00435]|uniref:hypothetical protein n=1 Tax=Streptomyces sp. NBC_00435 TaxID=2903649 RepID=UPI002E23E832
MPIGERIPFPADGIPFWAIFPYEGRSGSRCWSRRSCPNRRALGGIGRVHVNKWGGGTADV